ncbi:MAG TPA: nuclear transport factor 2 family protein [Caulobacterales bacterium]|nr:nuclear transport factor 2 family protein [Caulobacterales bacterium]
MNDLERMAIEHACARLQTRYCIYADNGEVENFVSLFAEDGSVAVPEHPAFVGHEAIRWSMNALVATGVTMRHIMTNSLVDVHDESNASGLCYLIAYGSKAPADKDGWRPMEHPGTIGHYKDVFRRTPNGWRFASRVLTRVLRKTDDPVLQAARGG